MTANQIEFWKLQETHRHNVVTEEMDKPLKEAQTQKEYASASLFIEQAKTQESVRALNYAQEYAAYAAGAASYASAENQYAQAELNRQRTLTEQYNTQLTYEQVQTERNKSDLTYNQSQYYYQQTETEKEKTETQRQYRIQAGYETDEVYATTRYNTNLYLAKDANQSKQININAAWSNATEVMGGVPSAFISSLGRIIGRSIN